MARANSAVNPSCANNLVRWAESGQPAFTRLTGLSGPPRTTGASSPYSAGAFTGFICGGGAFGAVAGETWSVVAWVRTSVARSLSMFVSLYNSSDAFINGIAGTTINPAAGVWTEWKLVFTIPSGLGAWTNMRAHVDLPTSASAGTLSMSSVRFEKISDAALTYADGATANWVWDGTAGSSTSQEVSAITRTGGAAARGAGSGVKVRTSAAVIAKTGGGAARGAASGPKTVTVAAVVSKAGAAAAALAGTGSRIRTTAVTHAKTGAGATTGAASGAAVRSSATTYAKTGSAAATAGGSGAKALTSATVRTRAGGAAAATAATGSRSVTVAGGVAKSGAAAPSAVAGGSRVVVAPGGVAKTGGATTRAAGSGANVHTVPDPWDFVAQDLATVTALTDRLTAQTAPVRLAVVGSVVALAAQADIALCAAAVSLDHPYQALADTEALAAVSVVESLSCNAEVAGRT